MPDHVLQAIAIALRPDLDNCAVGYTAAPDGHIVTFGCLARSFVDAARIGMCYQVELSSGSRVGALARFLRAYPHYARFIRRLTVRSGASTQPDAAELEEVARRAVNARAFVMTSQGTEAYAALARVALIVPVLNELKVGFVYRGGWMDWTDPTAQVVVQIIVRNAETLRSVMVRGFSWSDPVPPLIALPALRVLRAHTRDMRSGRSWDLFRWLADSAPRLDVLDLNPTEIIFQVRPEVAASVTSTSTGYLPPALLAFTSLRRLRLTPAQPITAGDFRSIPSTVCALAVDDHNGNAFELGIAMLADESWLPELSSLRWRYRAPRDATEAAL